MEEIKLDRAPVAKFVINNILADIKDQDPLRGKVAMYFDKIDVDFGMK